MDSTRLDTLLSNCVPTLSLSYRKTLSLLDRGNTALAASEFRNSFVTATKVFYAESSEVPPKRYLNDANWKVEIKNLYVQTQKTAGFLEKGDVNNARTGLESLREFFYKLHTANKINIANDAIYAFKKELDRDLSKGGLTEEELIRLNSLKAQVSEAAPSITIKEWQERYNEKAKAWMDEAGRILSQAAPDKGQIRRLREITDEFYLDYGMDFE